MTLNLLTPKPSPAWTSSIFMNVSCGWRYSPPAPGLASPGEQYLHPEITDYDISGRPSNHRPAHRLQAVELLQRGLSHVTDIRPLLSDRGGGPCGRYSD